MSNTSHGPLAGLAVVQRIEESVAMLAADPLRGTAGDDRFAPDAASAARRTGAGDDRVLSLGGNDYIDLGAGNDGARGGVGNDSLLGGDGDDTLLGEAGSDTLEGGIGSDSIEGGTGDDVLLDKEVGFDHGGVAYADTFSGGAGNDRITLGSGDKAYGGSGDDQFFSDDWYSGVSDKLVFVDGGAGNDRLTLTGTLGDGSVLRGGTGDDVLYLEEGYPDEEPNPENIGTLFDGGSGNDFLMLRGSMAGAASTLTGGSGDDVLIGAGQVLIQGGTGDDRIVGGMTGGFRAYLLANDIDVVTGAGRDTLVPMPSLGDDPVRVLDFKAGVGGDLLDLMPLTEALRNHFDYAPPGGFAGTQPFESGRVQLLVQGSDTLVQYYSALPREAEQWTTVMRLVGVLPEQLTADNFAPGQAPGGDHVARDLVGTNFDDTLVGYSGDDSLRGLVGNDLLDGGFDGRDSLVGDAGADQLFGFDGDDMLEGGDDVDLLSGGNGNDTLKGGDGNDGGEFSGSLHGIGLYAYGVDGGSGEDLVDGGAGDDTLVGGYGSDTVLGGDGNDTLYDGLASIYNPSSDGDHDEVDGGAGDDRIFVSESDLAVGGIGNDHISYAGGGDLTIDAGEGDDVVDTWYGKPVMGLATVSTGSGADIVRPGVDGSGETANVLVRFVVSDFDIAPGADRIDLVNVNRALRLADDADPFATGRARLTEADGATHLELDMDKNHTTWVRVLSLSGVDADAMTSDNFVQHVHPVVGPTSVVGEAGALHAADLLDLGGAGVIHFGLPGEATSHAQATSAQPSAAAGAVAGAVADALTPGNSLHAAWAGGSAVWQHESLASHANW